MPITSNAKSEPLILWLNYLPPSNNLIRRRHWAENHREDKLVRAALSASLQSQPTAADYLTKIMTELRERRARIGSQRNSGSTTANGT